MERSRVITSIQGGILIDQQKILYCIIYIINEKQNLVIAIMLIISIS